MMYRRSFDSGPRLAVSAIAALLVLATEAQTSNDMLVKMRRAYQDQVSVYLKRNTTIRIERTADGAVAFRDVEEQRLMLKDLVGREREQEVHYSVMIPLEKLEAHTLVPHKKGHKKVPIGNVDHRDERSDNIFHDDSRVASFLMPSMVSGSIGHVSYTLAFPDARLANGHYFAGMYPTEESTLTVITDPGIEVDIRMFHLVDSMVTRSVQKEKGKLVQRFTMRQVPALQFETNAPSARYYAPHAQLVVRLADKPGLNDVDRLYRWYRSYAREAFAPPTEDLQLLADSITQGITDPWAKAAKIHGWVQDNIRYVAFEDGTNGFIPAPATDVCRVRYGDCKGMSNLLQTLLRAAGMQASLAWVGTRNIPYTFDALPTLANNDHMIVALDLADTTLFLDPTASENAFGVPSGFTQGKETLIGLDSLGHRVQRIPVMPAEHNMVKDSLHLRIADGVLIGSGVTQFTGYERYHLSHWLRSVPVHKRTEALRSVLMKGSNKFLLDSCSIHGLDDREVPLVIAYHCRIPDHITSSGDRLYVPLSMSDPWKDLRISEGRRLPVEVHHKQMQQYKVTIELPEGARSIGLPIEQKGEGSVFGYSIDVNEVQNNITSTSKYWIDELMISDGLDEWEHLNRSLLKGSGSTIVIELAE